MSNCSKTQKKNLKLKLKKELLSCGLDTTAEALLNRREDQKKQIWLKDKV